MYDNLLYELDELDELKRMKKYGSKEINLIYLRSALKERWFVYFEEKNIRREKTIRLIRLIRREQE